MSKKKNKKSQQIQETPDERVRRIAREYGALPPEEKPVVAKEESVITENTAKATNSATSTATPQNVDEKAEELMDELEAERTRLSDLERDLKNREANLEQLVQRKSDEYIEGLGIDVPDAQKQVRDLLAEAKQEKDKIIAEGKRKAEDLKARAVIAKQDAETALARTNEREQNLAKLADTLSKKEIQLQNEELAYRTKIGEEIAEKYREQIAEIDSFEDTKTKLERKVEYFKKQYDLVNERLNELQATLADYECKKRELASKEDDCEQLEKECKDLRANIRDLKEQLSHIGTDPLAYKKQLEDLENEFRIAQDRLANVPSELELAELRRKADELEKLNKKFVDQEQKLFEATSELTGLRTKASQLDDYVQYVRILTESKRQLQLELASLQDQYESENNNKFKALSDFDRHPPKPNTTEKFSDSLASLTQKFLGFAQNDKPALYYEESTIAAFFSWMASTKIMILEGLSGTGKTSLPLAFSRFAGWYTPRVSVQSAWKDRNDLVGFFNDFKKEYKETEFLKDLYKATQNPDCPALIILDEMNLSRIEYYFADFLSALEEPNPSNRVIDLLPDQNSALGMPKLFVEGGKLPIKQNIWFVGTANKDDSTFAITDKVYDRAGVIHFSSRGEKTVNRANEDQTFVSYSHLHRLFDDAVKRFGFIANETYKKVRDTLIDAMSSLFEINIGNRIVNQMDIFVPVYLCCRNCDSKETVYEAIDEFFPHKVLRKLEGLYDANTKKNIGIMVEYIQEFHLPKTIKYLQKLQSKID